jgi:class 3 adenylate cyclase
MGLERPFELRIGINTGYCTVGNFGSEDRMDYTIIGNEVNLAERLQGRADPGGVLLAHETYSLTKDIIRGREQEPVLAKGFSKPIRNYSVLGIYDERTQPTRLIQKERNGFGLRVDLDVLGDGDREVVIQDIEQVLTRLRQE